MDKKFTNLMTLLIFVSTILLVLLLSAIPGKSPLYNAIRTLTRAKEESQPSSRQSIIFCHPFQAPVGSKINIDVFVRGASDQALANHTVAITSNLGEATPANLKSDKLGNTSFTLTSAQAGTAQISATINGTLQLDSKCTIIFK